MMRKILLDNNQEIEKPKIDFITEKYLNLLNPEELEKNVKEGFFVLFGRKK